jgi:putative hydrolase of HD superfamily
MISIDFHLEVLKLKQLPRTGWVKRGIPNPKSVAEHTYGSIIIVRDFALAAGLNADYCARMMECHDMPEIGAGDITPSCGISKQEKFERELAEAKRLAQLSGNDEILEMLLEYHTQETIESHHAYDADKLEPLLQSLQYASLYPEKREVMNDFWESMDEKVKTSVGHDYKA